MSDLADAVSGYETEISWNYRGLFYMDSLHPQSLSQNDTTRPYREQGWRQGFLGMVREDRFLIALILMIELFAFFLEKATGLKDLANFSLYSGVLLKMTIWFLGVFVLVNAVPIIFDRNRKCSATSAIITWLKTDYLYPRRVLGFLMVIILFPQFMSVFCALKANIPMFNPFSWDTTFMEWDYCIHAGHHPWELLHPFFFPLATCAINVCYNVWFMVLFFVVIWMAWSENRRVRTQFLLTWLLCFMVLGFVGATALSSAGPCYFDRVVGTDNPYAPLMTYLRSVNEHWPVWSLGVQDTLWRNYLAFDNDQLVKGISAMPSMHISTMVLMALAGYAAKRPFGIALWIFTGLIFIGSIHLGWHYAVDGYVSLLLTWCIWKLVGLFLSRRADEYTCDPDEFRKSQGT